MSPAELRSTLGAIDIYLLDQVLKGRITPSDRIYDAGCGGGRNVRYFLAAGHEVRGVDGDARAVDVARELAATLSPDADPGAIQHGSVEAPTVPDGWADVVISSAVLHFARDDSHFRAMLDGSWCVLRPGGMFFCRLASTIGMPEERFRPLGEGRYELPDGSTRYLVDQPRLLGLTEGLGGVLLEPLKTTVVQDMRCMTTWVVRKND